MIADANRKCDWCGLRDAHRTDCVTRSSGWPRIAQLTAELAEARNKECSCEKKSRSRSAIGAETSVEYQQDVVGGDGAFADGTLETLKGALRATQRDRDKARTSSDALELLLGDERAAHERTKAELAEVAALLEKRTESALKMTERALTAEAREQAAQAEAAATAQACVDILDAMATEYAGHEEEGGEQFTASTVLLSACWRLQKRGPERCRALAARVPLLEAVADALREDRTASRRVMQALETLDSSKTKL